MGRYIDAYRLDRRSEGGRMTPRVRQYMALEAEAAGVSVDELLTRTKRRPVAYARRRVAMRLSNDGFSNGQIAQWLSLDISTVHYYMQGAMPRRVAA